jgi:hypothetical protein
MDTAIADGVGCPICLAAENEQLRRFLDFAILWCTRKNISDKERVEVIRFHPVAQARIKLES